jgi:hypothetical protein
VNDIDKIDIIAAEFMSRMAVAADQVGKAMKLLISNGIRPIDDHREIAYAWAMGEIDDDRFLLLARIISTEAGR